MRGLAIYSLASAQALTPPASVMPFSATCLVTTPRTASVTLSLALKPVCITCLDSLTLFLVLRLGYLTQQAATILSSATAPDRTRQGAAIPFSARTLDILIQQAQVTLSLVLMQEWAMTSAAIMLSLALLLVAIMQAGGTILQSAHRLMSALVISTMRLSLALTPLSLRAIPWFSAG